jgi:hypothetical protein
LQTYRPLSLNILQAKTVLVQQCAAWHGSRAQKVEDGVWAMVAKAKIDVPL